MAQIIPTQGISDRVGIIGCFDLPNALIFHKLLAQMIWYFIEGVNYRAKDYPFCTKEDYQKFTVLLENDDPINFYKSNKSDRWWMEINLIKDNKYKRKP